MCLLKRQLETLSRERRQTLLERSAKELAEFFSVYEGKLLGTAAWRRMTGKSESQVNVLKTSHVICTM